MGYDASRRRAVAAAQWLAARALSEGAPATRNRVAAALGCDVTSLHARAAAEGWQCVDFRIAAAREAWEHFMRTVRGEAAFDGAGPEEAADAGMDDANWAENNNVARTAIRVTAPAGAPGAGDIVEADDADGDDPREMLSRGALFLSRRLSRLMRQAERGGAISKQEIDNLTAMTRMMDRWETLAKERAKHEETDRDGRIAEALRKIDRRILKLAREEAERLVAARGSEGDRGRDQ